LEERVRDELDQLRCDRAQALLDTAREARGAVRLDQQLVAARGARWSVGTTASTSSAYFYATALELEVDALATLGREDEVLRLTCAPHPLPAGIGRFIVERMRLQAQSRAGDELAAMRLLDLADRVDGYGDAQELEGLFALEHALRAALRNDPTEGGVMLRVSRERTRAAAARLERRYPLQVAHARNWLGISESQFPSEGLVPAESAALARDEIAWSQEHRAETLRDRLLRPLGAGELLLLRGDRGAATALFSRTLGKIRPVLPRHYSAAVAVTRLGARGLIVG
jgi:hypothetical protein